MIDKWTMGSSNERLYNGINSSEEGGTREKERKNIKKKITTVAPGKI